MSSQSDQDRLTGTALVARPGGAFALEEVRTAPLTASMIGIRTRWSGISFGTEFAVLTGKLDWGPFPITTGYMGAGVVTHVGADVTGFAEGDRVYYRRNQQLIMATGEELTCASGVHCSVAVLDPTGSHGADHIPPNVPDEVASMFVLPAVGLTGVDQAGVGLGDRVVVIGCGPIGLGVVAAATARGARVLAVDVRPEPLAVASRLGAEEVVDATTDDLAAAVAARFEGGADYVFEATGRHETIDQAITLLREFGCFVWQGNYGAGPVSFDFLSRAPAPDQDGVPVRRRLSTRPGGP